MSDGLDQRTRRARGNGRSGSLSAADRARLDQYMTSVRELEQRLASAEDWEYKPKPSVNAKPPEDEKDGREFAQRYEETLPDGYTHAVHNLTDDSPFDNFGPYVVPPGHVPVTVAPSIVPSASSWTSITAFARHFVAVTQTLDPSRSPT